MSITMIQRWKDIAARLKFEIYALPVAYKDSRTPWYAKLCVALVIAYALSRIDLTPDFIPIFGYLDDLMIISAGVILAMKMIPPEVMKSARETVQQVMRQETLAQ